ncbi:MAG: hypothetical protein ACRCZM_11650, partial [Bacteroidales bacterium]
MHLHGGANKARQGVILQEAGPFVRGPAQSPRALFLHPSADGAIASIPFCYYPICRHSSHSFIHHHVCLTCGRTRNPALRL